MSQKVLFSLICAGAFLCVQPVNIGFAQTGGTAGSGGMQNPTTPTSPGQTTPSQNPGMAGPAGPNGPDATTDMPPKKMDDKKFVKDAALGGMTEVELGKLAVQKATSDDLKQFGQKLIDDHTKANDQLKQVASKENIQIPDALDSKHQAKIDKLSKLSGEQFEKAYTKDLMKDHENDVKVFRDEAQNGSDPNIKAFASSTLPVLEEHLEHAKSLNKNEKKASKDNNKSQ